MKIKLNLTLHFLFSAIRRAMLSDPTGNCSCERKDCQPSKEYDCPWHLNMDEDRGNAFLT